MRENEESAPNLYQKILKQRRERFWAVDYKLKQINGRVFGLYVERTQKTGRTNNSRGYAFIVYHLDGETVIPNILAEATFIKRDDHIDVMTSVQKEHDHPLLVGTGLAIYKKVLELIEDLSQTSKKELVHIVTINRSISKWEKHLTTERWLAFFRPVLEERGYIQIDEEHWQKPIKTELF